MNETTTLKNYIKGSVSEVIRERYFCELEKISKEILAIGVQFKNTTAIRKAVLGVIVDMLKPSDLHNNVHAQAVEVARQISLKLH